MSHGLESQGVDKASPADAYGPAGSGVLGGQVAGGPARSGPTRRDKLLGGGVLLFGLQYLMLAAAMGVLWGCFTPEGDRSVAGIAFELVGSLILVAASVIAGLALLAGQDDRDRQVRKAALIAAGGTVVRVFSILILETGEGAVFLGVVLSIVLAALLIMPFVFLASAYTAGEPEGRNRSLASAATWLAVLVGLATGLMLLIAAVDGEFRDLFAGADFVLLGSFAVYVIAASVGAHAFRRAAVRQGQGDGAESGDAPKSWLVRRETLLMVAAVFYVASRVLSLWAGAVLIGPYLTGGGTAFMTYWWLVLLTEVPLIVGGLFAAAAFLAGRQAATSPS